MLRFLWIAVVLLVPVCAVNGNDHKFKVVNNTRTTYTVVNNCSPIVPVVVPQPPTPIVTYSAPIVYGECASGSCGTVTTTQRTVTRGRIFGRR